MRTKGGPSGGRPREVPPRAHLTRARPRSTFWALNARLKRERGDPCAVTNLCSHSAGSRDGRGPKGTAPGLCLQRRGFRPAHTRLWGKESAWTTTRRSPDRTSFPNRRRFPSRKSSRCRKNGVEAGGALWGTVGLIGFADSTGGSRGVARGRRLGEQPPPCRAF
jgi:hypothetical protein